MGEWLEITLTVPLGKSSFPFLLRPFHKSIGYLNIVLESECVYNFSQSQQSNTLIFSGTTYTTMPILHQRRRKNSCFKKIQL